MNRITIYSFFVLLSFFGCTQKIKKSVDPIKQVDARTVFPLEEKRIDGKIALLQREIAARLLKERDRIIGLYRERDYEGVIREILQLRSEFGSDAVSLEMGLLFALSLGEQGKLQEAVQLGEGIARHLEKNPDLTLLRDRMARWQLDLGRKNEAMTAYEQIVDDLNETSSLVAALKADMDKDAAPKNGAKVTGDKHSEEPVSVIADDGKTFEEEKAIRAVDVKNTVAAVRDLIESDQFEDAIRMLETISGVQDESADEVTLLKDRAVEGIINRDRNEAAQLFLSARNSTEPSKKEALLKSSLQILVYLLEKYPSSNVKDKILSNISRVENELKKLNENQ